MKGSNVISPLMELDIRIISMNDMERRAFQSRTWKYEDLKRISKDAIKEKNDYFDELNKLHPREIEHMKLFKRHYESKLDNMQDKFKKEI